MPEQKACDHDVTAAYIEKYKRTRHWKGKLCSWLGCSKCNVTFLRQAPLTTKLTPAA